MPKKRFNDEQIAFALRQAEAGTTVGEICRKLGIAEATFYRWKKVYAGMGVSEIRRLKQLEDENGKLKRLVADLTLDKPMLQDAAKKVVKPVRRREVVRHYQHVFEVSERRAMGFGRASHRYQSRRRFLAMIEGGYTPAVRVVHSATKAPIWRMSRDAIAAFNARFTTLTVLAAETGVHRNRILAVLETSGIKKFEPDGGMSVPSIFEAKSCRSYQS